MAELLVDTDVLVDHLRGTRRLTAGEGAAYSTITRAELFAGALREEDAVATLLEPLRELAVDRAVAERAGRVRRETGIALPDALIAATALVHGLALATRNRRHFRNVSGLELKAD